MKSIRCLALAVWLAFVVGHVGWSGEVTTWTSSLTMPGKTIQVFSRTQCHKYFNFLNVLHWWNDRPLNYDRSMRPAVMDGVLVSPGSDVAAVRNSLLQDAELAKGHLVDGLATVYRARFPSLENPEAAFRLFRRR